MRHALVERVLSRAQRASARCITVSIVTIVAAGLAAFGLTGAVGAQTLAALPTFTSKLAERGKAHPTPASIDFCRRMPTECKIDPAEPAVIALTPDVWQTLVAVNRAVNKRIKPITDLKHWGVSTAGIFRTTAWGIARTTRSSSASCS